MSNVPPGSGSPPMPGETEPAEEPNPGDPGPPILPRPSDDPRRDPRIPPDATPPPPAL